MQVQALPLQSLILQPSPHEHVTASADGTLSVQGVAYPGAGGAPIEAVEVSTDGGASWHRARLLREEVPPDDAKAPHHWLRWVAQVPLDSRGRTDSDNSACEHRCTVCCRAFDVTGQSQPRVSPQQRGYLVSA